MTEKDFRVRKGLVVDGTAGNNTSVAVTTGNVVVAAGTIGLTDGLLLSTVSGTPNVSKISSQPTDGNIKIAPNGDGKIVFNTDDLDVSADSMKISIKDNVAAALDITEASNSYLKFTTTNGSDEADSGLITFGKDSTFASTNIHNLGTVSAATSITSSAFVGPLDGIVGGTTPAAGTFTSGTFTSINMSEGNITNVGDLNADSISVDDAAVGLDIVFGGNTTLNKITLTDSLADALNITEGSNSYIKFNTSAEQIEIGEDIQFEGSANHTISIAPTSGTNQIGKDLIFEAGTSTGNVLGGEMVFKVGGGGGSSGSTPTSLTTALTLTGAGVATMPTVNIDGGNIDTTTIGASGQAAATVTIFKATNTGYISRVNALQSTTRFQVDGLDGGAGAGVGTSPSGGSTAAYAEARLFSDLRGDDFVSQYNDYSGMSGTLIIDNADDVAGVGQGMVLTVGEGNNTDPGDSWAIGRMLNGQSDFTIGYYPKAYESIGYKNSSTTAPNVFNPFVAAQSVFKIEKGGDVTLLGNKGDTVDGSTSAHIFNPVQLKFQGVDSGGTSRFTGFTIPAQLAASNSIYTLPDAYPSGSSKVLQSTTTGALSWVSGSGGSISALNNQSENRLVTMGSTTTELDGEAKATLDGHKMLLGEQSGSGETTSSESDPHLHIVRRQNVDIGSGVGSQVLGARIQAIDVADGHNAGHGVSVTGLNISALQTNTAGGTSATSKALQLSASGSTNNYAIYSSAGDAYFQSSVDNTPPQLTLAHIFNDTSGPVMNFLLDKGTAGATDDVLGQILFKGDDADQNTTIYAAIKADVASATADSEEGRLTFQMAQQSDGSLIDVMVIDGGDLADGTHSKVVIKGDLQVDGDTTTVNTAVLEVEDLNITVAKNAADAAAANGAGLTVAGASATLIYASSGDRWNFNKDLSVAGTLSADTSFTLDSTTISTAEIAVLDGISLDAGNTPDGSVTADKVLAVDANKDLNDSSNHLRDVKMRNLNSTGSVTSTQLSTEYGDIKTFQRASGGIAQNTAVTLFSIDSTAHRGAEVLTTVYNTTENTTDLFKTVIMWDGHDTTLNNLSAACHYTNYAVLSSGDVTSGEISAEKNSANIDIQFTTKNSIGTDTYVIRGQVTLLDI